MFNNHKRNTYNWLDPVLLPKVKCNAPETEGYEITNLINPNDMLRAQGFMAYTITKPPIEIEFELLCQIELGYICLDTQVGNQKCTGIEVFAKNQQYISVAKAVFDKPGVVFCNSSKYSKENPPEPAKDGSKALFFFRKDAWKILIRSKFIKIVIFRTAYSIPCLKSAQIVGEICKGCSKTTIDTVDEIWRRKKEPFKLNSSNPSCSSSNSNNTNAEPSDKINKNGLDVPKDFLDDLTYEIMANPMTLPSGKTIDRSTLEQHLKSEALFGRKPGDPFTGLKFTSTRKPILNVALKSRIDMFLLMNSANPATYNLKRTVGSSTESTSKKMKTEGKCSKCDIKSEESIFYSIPCDHLFCRTCIQNMDKIFCQICETQYSNDEVERFYC